MDKFRTFSLARPPRPDFSKEEVELITVKEIKPDGSGNPEYYMQPVFPKIPAEIAKKYHWISSYEEYQFLAAILFCLRFPKHTFTKNHKELVAMHSKEDVMAFANGTKKLNIIFDENILFYRFKLYAKYIGNTLLLIIMLLVIPFGAYFILRDKIGLNQKNAIIYSVVFYIGWLIFAKYITFFEELSFKVFRRDYDKKNNKKG
jgi:hypothetical protein